MNHSIRERLLAHFDTRPFQTREILATGDSELLAGIAHLADRETVSDIVIGRTLSTYRWAIGLVRARVGNDRKQGWQVGPLPTDLEPARKQAELDLAKRVELLEQQVQRILRGETTG